MRLSDVTIGKFCPADIDEVAKLEQQTAGAPHWKPADYEALFAFADALRRQGVVARTAYGVVGFAVAKVLIIDSNMEAELESIVVRADTQRNGLGFALMKALLARLAGDGVAKLQLEVRTSNLAAISLYNACGFCRTGLRKRYYRDPEEDAVLMELQIPVARLWNKGM